MEETDQVYETGGIVGNLYYIDAKVERCYNTGNIKLNSIPQGAGCIVGSANVGEITNCYNTGNIEYVGTGTTNGTASIYKIGGIVGETYNNVTIKNCYNTGHTDTGGGIVGVIGNDERQIVSNNYYLDEASDYGYYSSGISDEGGIISKSSSQMKSEDFVTLLNDEYDSYRLDTNNYNAGYPILIWINDIEIEQLPSKLSYERGLENLDLSGGTINLNYNYSEYNNVANMDDEIFTITGFDNSTIGTVRLIVKYIDEYEDEYEDEFQIQINDTMPPDLMVSYSTTEKTDQDVLVTIKANEEVKEVEGWTLAEDKLTLTKVYTENGEEEVTVYDLYGNSSKLKIEVNNIDRNENLSQENNKGEDESLFQGVLPYAGAKSILFICVTLIIVAIILYVKIKELKDVK